MDSLTLIMLIVIVALLAALAASVVWSVRRGRNWALARDDERMATAETHRTELELRAADHEDREAALTARNEATDKLRGHAVRAAARGMKWELASRHQLVKACENAGLDAVIATNVVFTPAEPVEHAFCAQIDHVVITQHLVLVVESKRWSGVVFDGVRPSTHAAAFSTLFDENEMIAPFAVQLTRPDEASQLLAWRVDSGKNAPAKQARKQAMRLRGLLRERTRTVPYIDTCVFYSHQRSEVIAQAIDQEGTARTLIATSNNIRRVIGDVHRSKRRRLDESQTALVIDTVRDLGADLVGTGRFADKYQSPVQLDYRFDDNRTAS
ncbi:MAG: nuclease-related domain-containing protein [Microbacterium gubbeenense]|uniref:nuclease-related domain-containing protein n=1 Tax=Microbacterium gubbeenense TaxID=159896 RepID=UPI003F9CC15F